MHKYMQAQDMDFQQYGFGTKSPNTFKKQVINGLK